MGLEGRRGGTGRRGQAHARAPREEAGEPAAQALKHLRGGDKVRAGHHRRGGATLDHVIQLYSAALNHDGVHGRSSIQEF
jgi:hypothetical protein